MIMSVQGFSWTHEATQLLLSLWGQESTQKQLKETKRNRCVFEKIAEAMNRVGYSFSWKQCRTKVKNMSQFYRKAVKEAGEEGKDPQCPYFSELDYILNPSQNSVPALFQMQSKLDNEESGEQQMEESEVPPTSSTSSSTGGPIILTTPSLPEPSAIEPVPQHSCSKNSLMLELNREEVLEAEDDDDDDDEDDDEEEEEEEEDEEEELVGAVPQPEWQQVPFLSVPQSVIYHQPVRTKTPSTRKSHALGRRWSTTGQQQQQGGVSTRIQKVGMTRNRTLGGQGSLRLESLGKQQPVGGMDEPVRNSHRKLQHGQMALRRLDGGCLTFVPNQRQQQQILQQQQHPVASMSEMLDNVDTTTLYQEHTIPTQGSGNSRRKRKAMDSDVLKLMQRLQEESEAREDARQQRLLEHEKRMEEKRQKWEEQRRERELEHQQQITQMFVQALEKVGKGSETARELHDSLQKHE